MLSSSILTTSLEVCHQTTTSKLAYGSQMFVVVCIYSILLFFLMPTLCNRLASRQSFKQRSDMNRIDNQVVNERRRWALTAQVAHRESTQKMEQSELAKIHSGRTEKKLFNTFYRRALGWSCSELFYCIFWIMSWSERSPQWRRDTYRISGGHQMRATDFCPISNVVCPWLQPATRNWQKIWFENLILNVEC